VDTEIKRLLLQFQEEQGLLKTNAEEEIPVVDEHINKYRLETVFCHLAEKFLKSSMSPREMVLNIFEELERCLETGRLSSFFDPSLNILAGSERSLDESLNLARSMSKFVTNTYEQYQNIDLNKPPSSRRGGKPNTTLGMAYNAGAQIQPYLGRPNFTPLNYMLGMAYNNQIQPYLGRPNFTLPNEEPEELIRYAALTTEHWETSCLVNDAFGTTLCLFQDVMSHSLFFSCASAPPFALVFTPVPHYMLGTAYNAGAKIQPYLGRPNFTLSKYMLGMAYN
jgi:hypothetical protein